MTTTGDAGSEGVVAVTQAPAEITYNPVYDVTYPGVADPTRGYVYRLAALADQRDERGGDHEVTQADRDLVDEVDALLRAGDRSGAECAVGAARIAAAPTDTRGGESALRDHLAEQIVHARTRIQDGIDMGAIICRIALEDIIRENTAALASPAAPEGGVERIQEALATATGIASGPNGCGRMKVVVDGLEPGAEFALHSLLSALLAARPPLSGEDRT